MLDDLRMSGSYKCVFPKPNGPAVDAVLVNTAGGITGGDRFQVEARALAGTALTLTTQAAERAYRAQPGQFGQLHTELHVEAGANLHWLPQETILFNGSTLHRRLRVELDDDARFLMVEPLILGRPAMGESLTDARFRDHVEINRAGRPIFLDRLDLSGDLQAHMARPFTGNGAGAMALLLYAAPDAEARLNGLRDLLSETAGASLIRDGLLVARVLARDGFALRQVLEPALTYLSQSELPKCWTL
ncbi:urease accessory protein UreD [Ruegeria sp. 2205SS24-7]|uniref:urease accessory protein UreD n=1 Tax=Ruegeria discodermiae TaxID=3064389 RepID=UPI0027414F92|nr:urease accessory protein UreD [Ruegeria sp. 2205SS24-7]MDP5219163.1 urease accessory protein UreD [Ruegeria sp. 2205SS24-7]